MEAAVGLAMGVDAPSIPSIAIAIARTGTGAEGGAGQRALRKSSLCSACANRSKRIASGDGGYGAGAKLQAGGRSAQRWREEGMRARLGSEALLHIDYSPRKRFWASKKNKIFPTPTGSQLLLLCTAAQQISPPDGRFSSGMRRGRDYAGIMVKQLPCNGSDASTVAFQAESCGRVVDSCVPNHCHGTERRRSSRQSRGRREVLAAARWNIYADDDESDDSDDEKYERGERVKGRGGKTVNTVKNISNIYAGDDESDASGVDEEDEIRQKEVYVVDQKSQKSTGSSLEQGWWKRMAMQEDAGKGGGILNAGSSWSTEEDNGEVARTSAGGSMGSVFQDLNDGLYESGKESWLVEEEDGDPNWDMEAEWGRGYRYSEVLGDLTIERKTTVGDPEEDYDEYEDYSDVWERERNKRFREIGVADWEEVTFDPSPLILCAFSRWCRPCSVICNNVEETAEKIWEQGKLRLRAVKLDINKEPDLAAALEVNAHPTLFFIEDGKVLHRMEIDEGSVATPDEILQCAAHFFYGGPKPEILSRKSRQLRRGRPSKPQVRRTISEEAEHRATIREGEETKGRRRHLYVAPEGRRRTHKKGERENPFNFDDNVPVEDVDSILASTDNDGWNSR